MTLDSAIPAITTLHVTTSLIGIAAGFVVLRGMWKACIPHVWTATFLAATVATSATGFLFKPLIFDPPQVVGVLSLLILALTVPAIYQFRLQGAWRRIYVVGALLALYLNVFVAIVQAFQKVALLHELAPTQTAPPFLLVQSLAVLFFAVSGVYAWRRFKERGLS